MYFAKGRCSSTEFRYLHESLGRVHLRNINCSAFETIGFINVMKQDKQLQQTIKNIHGNPPQIMQINCIPEPIQPIVGNLGIQY
jgi:hypothetical protein